MILTHHSDNAADIDVNAAGDDDDDTDDDDCVCEWAGNGDAPKTPFRFPLLNNHHHYYDHHINFPQQSSLLLLSPHQFSSPQ